MTENPNLNKKSVTSEIFNPQSREEAEENRSLFNEVRITSRRAKRLVDKFSHDMAAFTNPDYPADHNIVINEIYYHITEPTGYEELIPNGLLFATSIVAIEEWSHCSNDHPHTTTSTFKGRSLPDLIKENGKGDYILDNIFFLNDPGQAVKFEFFKKFQPPIENMRVPLTYALGIDQRLQDRNYARVTETDRKNIAGYLRGIREGNFSIRY